MPSYVVEPLVGVAPIRLGMPRSEARRLMPEQAKPFRKTPNSEHETDAFHKSAFQIFYKGEPPTVEYIELSRSKALEVLFRDLSVFDTPADELLATLGRWYDFDSDDSHYPCDVIFPDLEMSLWRPHGSYSPSDEDGRYFSTVGVGVHGYYTRRD
jgi:hypothetical protein